jgi:hypothetical protein
MPEPNWLESRKKRSRWYVYAIFPIILLAAVFIFLRNNRDVLFSKQERTAPAADLAAAVKPAEIPAPKPAGKTALNPPQRAAVKPAEAALRPASGEPAARRGNPDCVTISDIVCRLSGRDRVRLVVSLDLFFQSGELRREVLLKRDDLKVMVQKTFAEKTMSELVVDSLRQQAKRAMNRILEKGAIADVAFRNFSIEKVQ